MIRMDDHYRRTKYGNYLELHCSDGTYRGVLFDDPGQAERAVQPGRAAIDREAVVIGLLPSGAYLVSRAGVSDQLTAMQIRGEHGVNGGDPLELVRTRFSASLRAGRSDYVTGEKNEAARRSLPRRAAAYDAGVRRIDEERPLG